MTEPSRNDLALLNELHAIIVARCEGTLDEAGFARLEQLVVKSPVAGEMFARYMLQTAGLRAWATSVGDSGSAETPEHETRSPAVPTLFKRVLPSAFWLVHHDRPVSWVAAAVVVGIAVGAMTLMFMPKPVDRARQTNVAQLPASGGRENPAAAWLARVHEAEWGTAAEDGQVADPAKYLTPETLKNQPDLFPGDRLYLKRGLAEINFANGALVVLEGPAHLQIEGAANCALDQGKLVARVELREARGFAVRTPTTLITDLGTEFGVAVRGQETSLAVMKGVVTAQSRTLAHGGSETLGQATRVVAGQAARVDKIGKFSLRAPDGKMFAETRMSTGPAFRSIPIENPSFEVPVLSSRQTFRLKASGWRILGSGAGVCNFGPQFEHGTPHGSQHLFLNEGEVRQVLRENLAPETLYRLTIWVGNRPGEYSPNFSVELLAGQTVLTSATNEPKPPKGHFGRVAVEYRSGTKDVSLGQPLTIVLRSHGSLATKTQNHFDVVRLEARAFGSSAPPKKIP